MAIDNDKQIIEERLEAYRKATTVMEYQKAIAALNKYHDPIIAKELWTGLVSKERKDFPLVAFFATVSSLESYDKNPKILDVFIQRWKNDYEEKILNDLTLHRAIEVIHIIINEAFRSYRNDDTLNEVLVRFLEKKALRNNDDGIYKTIDAFKFFPKKIGLDAPVKLMQGLVDIIAKYFEQQLSNGKYYKEILAYIDFFTDKTGKEKALQMARKVEKKFKSELFVTFPGEYVSNGKKGEVYVRTAMPFAYSEEYKEKELRIKGIEEIVIQLGGTVSSMLSNIEVQEMVEEIKVDGVKKFLEDKETFQLSSSNAKEVMGKLPPVVPAFVMTKDDRVSCILNARYAENFILNDDCTFTLFGRLNSETSQEGDRIDGVIFELQNNREDILSNDIEKAEQENLMNSIELIVSDISVEVRKLDSEKSSLMQEFLKEEEDMDAEQFLGFSGEKERQLTKKTMCEKREACVHEKEKEIISAFKLSFKKRAIETIDDINSLTTLDNLYSTKDIVDRLSQVKGVLAPPAEIIKDAILKCNILVL
ncbi:MAG: hypothetical protein ACUZ8E_11610 [Candidatus Anammoxibacter sp.]